MKLKVRLLLTGTLQVVLVLAGILAFVYWHERQAIVGRLEAERRGALEKLARICQSTLDAQEEKILLSYLRVWMESPEVEAVSLWDSAGVVHIHSNFLKGDYSVISETLEPAFLARINASSAILSGSSSAGGQNILFVAAPVYSQGKRFGFVLVKYDADLINRGIARALNESVRDLALIGVGGGALGLLIAWLLALSLTRPIRVLSDAAREIGEGRFPDGISVKRSDELGELAADLTRMAAKLKQLDEFKDNFLRSVSHNMRSPLAAVESAAYHARHFIASSAPSVQEDFRTIDNGIKELTAFINNLLDLERMKAGKMVFLFRSADITALLEQSSEMFRRFAQDRGVQLNVREVGVVRPIELDQNLIGQVISNLVVNAIKFTPSGGAVELEAREVPEGVRVSVLDTGPGIPADKIAQVFETFRQFGPAGGSPVATKGSGLGLALCREVIAAHHGRIWVENRPDGGAVFRFIVPFTQSGAEAEE